MLVIMAVYAQVLPVAAIIPVFGLVTLTFNAQNVEWGKDIWRIYSSLDELSLAVEDGAEIYVENPPSTSHLTPIAFHYFPRRVLVDNGVKGFYYHHEYGETFDPDTISFLSFVDRRLVRDAGLMGAIMTRFDLRESARFTPTKLCWTASNSVPAELLDYTRQLGEVRSEPESFSVSKIDIPVSLLDTLVLSFDRANKGAMVVGRFNWRTNADALSLRRHSMGFTGRVADDGLLRIDLALSTKWLWTRSIEGFSVEFTSDRVIGLAVAGFSSDKQKPKSRLIEITLPRGKSFSRAPRAVIGDLLREAK